MPRVRKDSKKADVETTKATSGTNVRRRKNKGSDEAKPKTPTGLLRPRRSKKEVLSPAETKVIVPPAPVVRVFDVNKLKTGDKFTFISPGKAKRAYICIVTGSSIQCERDDKYKYERPKDELLQILKSYNVSCTLL